MSFTVAFSGSRGFDEPRIVAWTIRRLVNQHPSSPAGAGLVIQVGDCPTGADPLVAKEATRWGIWPDVKVCYWPPEGATKRERWLAAHERNGRVVAGADRLIAFFAPGPLTPGTSDAVAQAQHLGIPVYAYHEGRWL